MNTVSFQSIQNRRIDEFIKERERYALIGDDLDMAFVELIPGVEFCYNDRHPKPPTPIKPKSPTPVKAPTPPGFFFFFTSSYWLNVLAIFPECVHLPLRIDQ